MGEYEIWYTWWNRQGNIVKTIHEFVPHPPMLGEDVGIRLGNSPTSAVRLTVDIAIPEF